MYEQAGGSAPQSNPFDVRDADREAENRYYAYVREVARRFVYDSGDLNATEIDKTVKATLNISGLRPLEAQKHELEKLSYFLKALEAHERADAIHRGAWQAALVRQIGHLPLPPKPPEQLTRPEVAREFELMKLSGALLRLENQALEYYTKLLALDPNYAISVSDRISLDCTDVAVLVNDLRLRQAERMGDGAARKAVIANLNQGLEAIVAGMPADDMELRGKRYELEDMLLLRQLIQRMDVGHLVTVCHGTPREDLRQPEKYKEAVKDQPRSVDLVITFAGRAGHFQVKTYESNVPAAVKAEQQMEIARVRKSLEGTPTRLAVTSAEDIRNSYAAYLRHSTTDIVTLSDKYRTFRPFLHEMKEQERGSLLMLLGLTESDLKQEEERLQAAWGALATEREAVKTAQTEQTQKAAQELRPFIEAEEAAARAAMAAEQARVEAVRLQQVRDAEVAQAQRQEAYDRDKEKQETVAEKLRLSAEKDAAKRAEDERRVAEDAEREKKRLAREEKKKNAPWRPAYLSDVYSPSLLIKLQLLVLPPDRRMDPQALLKAKKEFFKLFGKPKKGKAVAEESDKPKPNDRFAEAFPTPESVEAPTDEDIARALAAIKKIPPV